MPRSARPSGLGTFSGVFTPSILTILGIILFQRLGFIVGTAGLFWTLLAVTLAVVIAVLTALSLSAVATNIRVKKGGDYYLISRTLGAEFGGAIGLVLFGAQAISIAFYCVGLGEVVSALAGHATDDSLPRVIAGVAIVFLMAFAYIGADWATRFQYVVMAVLVVAIGSFFLGGLGKGSGSFIGGAWGAPEGHPGFWPVFALFFPAVTGFTQGVSMSGDLRDPARSLPRGTFLAIGVSALVYYGAVFLFAATLPLSELSGDYDAMRTVSAFGPLIDAGVIAATLSSAMASFLGAPRILQALAQDKIFPILGTFAHGSGPAENPRRGVLLTAALALATVGLGSLNVIAAVVTMFFLVSYALLNYATYAEAKARSPSFRPRFKYFSARWSLVGAIACALAMLAIDVTAGVVAGVLFLLIREYIRRSGIPPRWSDGRYAHRFGRVREDLKAMAGGPPDPRDWRPHILAFSDEPRWRERLLRFATWIEGGSGLTTLVKFIPTRGAAGLAEKKKLESDLRDQFKEMGVEAYPLVVSTDDPPAAARTLVQSYGVGPLRANTLLLHWLDDPEVNGGDHAEREYADRLRLALRHGRNVVVLETSDEEWARLGSTSACERRIDVWWWEGRLDATAQLQLMLAYLMTRSNGWEDATLNVIAVAPDEAAREVTREKMEKMLEEVRIDAETEVVVAPDALGITARSRGATIVFLPLLLKDGRPADCFGGPLEPLVASLPITALVIASEQIELDVEPDEGAAAKRAAEEDEDVEAEHHSVEPAEPAPDEV